MKILRYAQTVKLSTWNEFPLIPEQTITDDHPLFDGIVRAVAESGIPYTLVEQSEKLLASGPSRGARAALQLK